MSKKKSIKTISYAPSAGSFTRNCLNCLKASDCKEIPPKESMKRWREWCGKFIPNYAKIDRTRTNHAVNQLISPNSRSGRVIAVEQAGRLLDGVEEVLTNLGRDMKEG